MNDTRLRRMAALNLAGTFAVVGLIFLVIPGKVLATFNWLARGIGWPESTTAPYTLYLALALGYMYVVTVLALQMARHPGVREYPWVLVQAKAASSIVCIGLFAFQEQYLLYLANFVVDGAIAVFVWWLYLRRRAGRADVAPAASGQAAEPADPIDPADLD